MVLDVWWKNMDGDVSTCCCPRFVHWLLANSFSDLQEALELEFLARLQLQLGQFKEGRKSGEEALKILIGAVFFFPVFWEGGLEHVLFFFQF